MFFMFPFSSDILAAVQWLGNELSQSIDTDYTVWVKLCFVIFT